MDGQTPSLSASSRIDAFFRASGFIIATPQCGEPNEGHGFLPTKQGRIIHA
jgi:hypothetical protein